VKRSFKKIPKKVWERLSGIEPRRLWAELSNTRTELSNTRTELSNTQKLSNQRDRRMHPFITEALALIADSGIGESRFLTVPDSYESPFTLFGSDKDTRHSYGHIYLEILEKFESPRVLEIGVGSINDFPYAGLAAGGALKGFRSRFPKATIVGIDIDPHSIEEIKADNFLGYVVDQTSDESLIEVKLNLEKHGPYDLIIDDGFHDPHANIRTLKSYYSLLSENGTYIIEDVHETLIDFWKVIGPQLPGFVDVTDLRSNRPDVDDNILIIVRK